MNYELKQRKFPDELVLTLLVLGDAVDLALLGAGWDKDRAAELRGKLLFPLPRCALPILLIHQYVFSVSSSVYTTFYFGALANPEDLLTNVSHPSLYDPSSHATCQRNANFRDRAQPDARPHFKGIFTSSYGLNREQLEELNFLIRSSDPVVCDSNKKRVRIQLLCIRIHALTVGLINVNALVLSSRFQICCIHLICPSISRDR